MIDINECELSQQAQDFLEELKRYEEDKPDTDKEIELLQRLAELPKIDFNRLT